MNDQQDYSDESLLQQRVVNAFTNLSDTVEFSPNNLTADNILIISELGSRFGSLCYEQYKMEAEEMFALESIE